MANTVIGPSIIVEGEITGEEGLVVQGTVKGKIAVDEAVFVENAATVEADVDAETVEVAGTLVGNVATRSRFEIKDGGRMIGDLRSPRLLIADGALFKGNIDMDVGR